MKFGKNKARYGSCCHTLKIMTSLGLILETVEVFVLFKLGLRRLVEDRLPSKWEVN